MSKTVLTQCERVRLALAHKEGDWIPIHDSPWSATVSRWRHEGLPDDVSVDEYFGFALRIFGYDWSPRYPARVIDRTPEYITESTSFGGIRRNHRDHSTTPELIDYGVKSRADWEAAKRRIEPGYTRVDWVSLRNGYEKAEADGAWKCLAAVTGYDACQYFIRSDELLPLLLTDPSWIQDMIELQADLFVGMAKLVIKEGFRFDGVFFWNDMGYRNASLFSPKVYRELIKPADRRLFDFCHAQGWPIILHSCGCVKELIPDLIDAGLDCLEPLEVKAGMDLVELKRQYGKNLAFMGGIDARAMANPDPRVIEQEIATKIPVAKAGGGYIYHSDHSIPYDVSFPQFCHVIELARQYGQYE